jgi:hypothetical protein
MDQSRLLHGAREFGVAWLRMAAALQIVLLIVFLPTMPFLGLYMSALLFPFFLVLATPLAFTHRIAVRREGPFLRRGYWVVALYGPAVITLLVVLAPIDGEVFWTVLVTALIYQLAALMVTGVYLWLWHAGDRWFGTADSPKRAPRYVLAVGLTVALGVYIPYASRVIAEDTCRDRGGRVGSAGACEFGQ